MPLSDIVFKMNAPITIRKMDRVEVHGIIKDDAEKISVSFVNDADNVTYHLKWVLSQNVLMENSKRGGSWGIYRQFECQRFEGKAFGLQFVIAPEVISTYSLTGNNRALITRFNIDFPISQIKSIQVGGDVLKVPQLNFIYANLP